MTTLPFIGGIAPERPALLDDSGGDWLTYSEISQRAADWASRLAGPRGVAFLYAHNDIDSVTALIGALAAGHAVALFDPKLPADARADLEKKYQPAWVVGPEPGKLTHPAGEGPLHPDVAILLSTSGSTGSAKLVRLTRHAVEANAAGIAEVLHICDRDVAAGYLPLHYSYGLSVLTSHLISGARIRLTELSLTSREFWPEMRRADITHMPGVPFHHQIMIKLGLSRLNLPNLRVLTQAGGPLDPELRWQAYNFMRETGGQFFVMYGQTEAAPRMTTLQHEDFHLAPQSCGTALPGCRIEISNPDSIGQGEVIFHGPNVMLGYAESREDLGRGDEMGGRLPTGDIGVLDATDRLTITGRVKRAAKLFGLRISLDEVEMLTNTFASSAVTQCGEVLVVHLVTTGSTSADEALKQRILARLHDRFTIPHNSYEIRIVPAIPRTERGKTDYAALTAPT